MTKLRLALVLAFVSLPLAAAQVADLRAASPRTYDAKSLPDRLGAYSLLREEPLEDEVVTMLDPESYTMRLYGDDRDTALWIYFAIYTGTGTTGAHDPAVCYPAQGWDASEPREEELVLANGERMAVKLMSATLGGQEERVLYWFQPAERWPTFAPREQIERTVDGLAGRPQYGFVRLSIQPVDTSLDARAAADARLADLAVAVAPWTRQSVLGRKAGPELR